MQDVRLPMAVDSSSPTRNNANESPDIADDEGQVDLSDSEMEEFEKMMRDLNALDLKEGEDDEDEDCYPYEYESEGWFNDSYVSGDKCWKLHDLSGGYDTVFLTLDAKGAPALHLQPHSNSWDDEAAYISKKFNSGSELRAYANGKGCIFPEKLFEDLNSGVMSIGRVYNPSLLDIVQIEGEKYRSSWSFGWESPDAPYNTYYSETLADACSKISVSGAGRIEPGNSGFISVGTYTLTRSHFESDGLDRGDSHVNPSVRTQSERLFEELLAYEAESPKKSMKTSPRP